jgi:iron-only hydrogenase group A
LTVLAGLKFWVLAFKEGETPTAAAPAPSTSVAPKLEVDHLKLVQEQLALKSRVTIAQVAPAVRVAIGEDLGLPAGVAATGKLVTALRLLGFDYVFDVLAGADLTIMEEGTELLHRIRDGGVLPMFTSCCPGWVEFVEKCDADLIPHLSTAKSPHMMEAALIKEYFSQKIGKTDSELSVVSIMPCIRKQGEADRIHFQTKTGAREVDHVLTTKDIANMIKEKGFDFESLPEGEFDPFMGIGSGAGAIFGTTGGVMEAALRTVVEVAGGEKMETPVYEAVRGLDGVREATVTIPANPDGPLHNKEPVELHVAVANGLGNAKKLVKQVEEGTANYHFVEVMACPGGCIGGGGQPRSKDKEILQKRQSALYDVDERKTLRRSHENPIVKEIYGEYLGEPCSERAHELLHTHYVECGPGKFDITAPRPEAPACDVVLDSEACLTADMGICEVSDSAPSAESSDEDARRM